MNASWVWRSAVCISAFGLFLYAYIDKQNAVMQLRIKIPSLVKEIRAIEEENTKLQYEIDQFENPNHLMELARHNEFSHLKHPLITDILTVSEGAALHKASGLDDELLAPSPQLPLAVRLKQ